MICANLTQLLGFECHPLGDGAELACVITPFKFPDGDDVPIYIERTSAGYRFFDDGQILLHFMGRGMRLTSGHQMRFISNIAEQFGVALNNDGIIELFAKDKLPSQAFAMYLSCMLQLVEWEKEHVGLDANAAAFSAEVAHALHEWQPDMMISNSREYAGASGKMHAVDLQFGSRGVFAVNPKPQKTAHVLYKLVDITSKISNSDEEFLVVIDDRSFPDKARNEAEVFRSVANVMTFTKLASMRMSGASAIQ